MATQPDYPLLTAEEFLEFSFGDRKAELDRGVIRVLSGVTARHSIVQGNIQVFLHTLLRGTGKGVYGSLMPIRISSESVRRADAVVVDSRASPINDDDSALTAPLVIFEILSSRTDLGAKLWEYQSLTSVDTVVLVDTAAERLRVVQRTGPNGWSDVTHTEPTDVSLPSLAVTVPHDEIFARD